MSFFQAALDSATLNNCNSHFIGTPLFNVEYLKPVQDRYLVTMQCQSPWTTVTHISSARHYSVLNISNRYKTDT